MPGKKLTLLICLSLAGLILVSVGFTFWAKANRATLKDVAIGTAAWRIRIAKNFNYDKQGHFGAQTQYLSKDVDSQNGKYCIQCKQGKVSAIFVKYTPPISREESLRAVARLVGEGSVNIFDDSSENGNPILRFLSLRKFCSQRRYFSARDEICEHD